MAELRAWLNRFIARVEADLASKRAEANLRDRRVDVVHGDEDAMAWVNAFVPSHVAAAIDRRLDRAAKALGADDDRTLDQRRADLLGQWATTGATDNDHGVATEIAVTIDAQALAGLQPGLAVSDDGSWAVPIDWILTSAHAGSTVWHRLLIDPITRNTLAHEYVGRFAPDALAKAIAFRDGVCRAPGCLRPAKDCDLDHRVPHPRGATVGDNLWALCRRHHRMKGHGVIRWQLPHDRQSDSEPMDLGPPIPLDPAA